MGDEDSVVQRLKEMEGRDSSLFRHYCREEGNYDL